MANSTPVDFDTLSLHDGALTHLNEAFETGDVPNSLTAEGDVAPLGPCYGISSMQHAPVLWAPDIVPSLWIPPVRSV